jgi:PAS domain S-box-containing protein
MDGEVVRVNVRTQEISGHDQEELVGRCVTELFEAEDESVDEAVRTAIQEGEARLRAELVTDGGDGVSLTLRQHRLVGPSGDPLGVVGFGQRGEGTD